jgi:hypothetical protein
VTLFAKLWRRADPAATAAPVAADRFAVLRGHAVIAWDLDDTLLGHAASAAMHDFIRTTPGIRHLIVTFRATPNLASIWADLAGVSMTEASFVVAETIDETLSAAFLRLQRSRRAGLFAGPLTQLELIYLGWKGAVCSSWGATVLIDDMTEHVRRGCETHGVLLLHPDMFV